MRASYAKMQANPDKFQAIMLGKPGFENCKSLFLNGTEIKCEDSVKLLGVTIDFLLNFDLHVSNICKKAARQINVLLQVLIFVHLCGTFAQKLALLRWKNSNTGHFD